MRKWGISRTVCLVLLICLFSAPAFAANCSKQQKKYDSAVRNYNKYFEAIDKIEYARDRALYKIAIQIAKAYFKLDEDLARCALGNNSACNRIPRDYEKIAKLGIKEAQTAHRFAEKIEAKQEKQEDYRVRKVVPAEAALNECLALP